MSRFSRRMYLEENIWVRIGGILDIRGGNFWFLKFVKRGVSLFLLLCLSGCVVGPDYVKPQLELPGNWGEPHQQKFLEKKGQGTQDEAIRNLSEWWKNFNDPQLESFIKQSVGNNLSLEQAKERTVQARAEGRVVLGNYWPGFDYSGSATSRKEHGGNDETAKVSSDKRGSLYQSSFDAAWELDVFGANTRSLEKAAAEAEASEEALRDVLVSLVAEVALVYYDILAARAEAVVAEENLAAQRTVLDLTEERFRAGFVSALDVANARAQVATTVADLPLVRKRAKKGTQTLALLLGKNPLTFASEDARWGELAVPEFSIPFILPAQVMRQRPDVRQAEFALQAASARRGIALSDYFPKLTLGGLISLSASSLGDLFSAPLVASSIGPTLRLPLIDGGQRAARRDVEDSRYEEALSRYKEVVLVALEEVQTCLLDLGAEEERLKALVEAQAENARALTLSTKLYREGETDFLNVLSAERALYQSQNSLVASRASKVAALIRLFKSLGGGWSEEQEKAIAYAQRK